MARKCLGISNFVGSTLYFKLLKEAFSFGFTIQNSKPNKFETEGLIDMSVFLRVSLNVLDLDFYEEKLTMFE